jgi:hypothetical protein
MEVHGSTCRVHFLTYGANPAVSGRIGDLEMLGPKPKRKSKKVMLKVTTLRTLDRAAKLQNKTQDQIIADALDSYVALIEPFLESVGSSA